MTTVGRVFGFDLLRCLAIVLVLITHTLLFISPGLYRPPVYTGLFGVEFFFVLSGFLIGTILLKIYHQTEGLTWSSLKVFWIRRWFRTLPNYYLMFLVYAILIYGSHHLNVFSQIKYLSYLVFLQNSVHYQPNNFFPVAWSLSIEEWFYLIFPLLLFLLTSLFKKNKAAAFLSAILVLILAELTLRLFIALTKNMYWDEGFRKLMPVRLDSIAIGVLAAYIKFHCPAFWNKKANLTATVGIFMLIALSVYFSFQYVRYFDPITWDHLFNPKLFLKTLFLTSLSFSIALLFPYLDKLPSPPNFVARPITFISKISYSIYLSHYFIILILSHIFVHLPAFKYNNLILFVVIWLAVVSISAVQYHFFEVKATALRNRFSKRQTEIKI